jgi:citrate synthase
MIESIAAADSEPRAWLQNELDEGRRIMGMGHRVYQIKDPRARAFENAAERMGETRPDVEARLELARQIESDAKEVLESHKPGLDLYANVEFYTAVLLDSVGLPSELFSLMFASGRTIGWTAHVLEQWRRGRLIRPRAEYDGPEWEGGS